MNTQTATRLYKPPLPPAALLTLHHLGGERREDLKRNRLLAVLYESLWRRWAPLLEPVDLPQGAVLSAAGSKMWHVYFPTTASVSLLTDMENGSSVAMAVIGNEGMVGTWVLLGGESANIRARVESAGRGLRMRSSDMLQEFKRAGPAMDVLLRYTHALMIQISQTAACNRHHSLEQRMCRWLLLSLDRHSTNELQMTHEHISNVLGVRREGISEAAARLQKRGIIKYHRGQLTVLNRDRLQHVTCECYGVVKNEYDRLLPDCGL